MIHLSAPAQYMMMMLHFMTWTLLLCGGLMWMERENNPKERKILALTFLLSGVIMMLRVASTYKDGIQESYQVLPIGNLYGGYLALLLVFFYPIEAISPGWLRWKNILLLFSPMIAITLILAVVPFEFRALHSWSDIMAHINEANVWFRLIVLFAIIVPYMLLLLFLPYNWRESSVDVKWICTYTIGIQGISVFYIWFMLTGSLTASFVHLLYCTLFLLYIVYQELHLRLFPDVDKISMPEIPEQTPKEPVASFDSLMERFTHYMSAEQPWLSPDITIGEVAEVIGVSRSRLSAEISMRGDDSFHAIVARYRVEQFCKMARNGKIENVNEALFTVGFRSRSTAYDRFKEQTGMTPAEYVRTIKTGGV